MKKRILALGLAGALMCALLSGCQRPPEPAQTTIFAMDTVMSLTLYGENGEEALAEAVEAIYNIQGQMSVTDGQSPLYALNRDGSAQLPEEVCGLLADALALCDSTGGALDITAYPAVKAWGFTGESCRIPPQQELESLAQAIDYTAIQFDPTTGQVALPSGVEVDLGAVAKGHAADRLVDQLEETGIQSALLDLGQSTIQALGAKPDGTPWRVGIQDPAGESYLGVLEIADQGMGTSGGYQRFFEEDGVRYWHILDPDTAAPARSGLASVTVVSPSGLLCDGLSTALFVMGLEDGHIFWQNHPELNFEALFIAENGAIYMTPGLEDSFSLAQGYEDREVTVLDE